MTAFFTLSFKVNLNIICAIISLDSIITFVLCGYSIIFVHFIENITIEHINRYFLSLDMNKRKERLGV
ncbi:hypothetical protein C4D24_05600 [Clostridium perfringens]